MEADGLRSEVEELTSKNKEGVRQLEEIAAENEELLGRLRSTEDKLRREMEDAGARARREAGALDARAAKVSGRSESLEEDLGAARSLLLPAGRIFE